MGVGHELTLRQFRWLLGLIVVTYLGLEVSYVLRLPFVMDEFAGASHVHRMKNQIPYVDFQPYKTVLGYYFQLPFLALGRGIVDSMLAVKLGTAVAVATTLAWTSLRLGHVFDRSSVLLGLAALSFHSTFLERSAELRVDMLTGLAGLISLVFFVERRWFWCGVWAGLSMLVSQKGALYVACAGAGRLAWTLIQLRERHFDLRRDLRETARYALGVAFLPVVYLLLVAGMSSPVLVSEGTLGTVKKVVNFAGYPLDFFWWQTLVRNETFSLLTAGAVITLTLAPKSVVRPLERATGVYVLTCLAIGVWYPHPWPYFFVLLLPTAAVGLAVGHGALGRRLPFLRSPQFALILLALLVVKPVLLRAPKIYERDLDSQRKLIAATEALLGSNGTYLAGVPMIYTHRQPTKLTWLDEPRMQFLHANPGLVEELLDAEPPQVVLQTYRIAMLPPASVKRLERDYFHVGLGLRTYSPRIDAGVDRLDVLFDGTYRILNSDTAGATTIDGTPRREGDVFSLSAGSHEVSAPAAARLLLWSEDPAFRAIVTLPRKAPFKDVYTY